MAHHPNSKKDKRMKMRVHRQRKHQLNCNVSNTIDVESRRYVVGRRESSFGRGSSRLHATPDGRSTGCMVSSVSAHWPSVDVSTTERSRGKFGRWLQGALHFPVPCSHPCWRSCQRMLGPDRQLSCDCWVHLREAGYRK